MTDDSVYRDIIWSADLASPEDVLAKLNQIGRPITVKLDRLFHRKHGDWLDHTLRKRGYWVFNDAKIVEIPSKVQELAEIEIKLTDPWMLNCMAGVLSTGLATGATKEERDKIDGLKRFADVCNEANVLSCAVTVLTGKTDDIVQYEFGERTPTEQVLQYVAWLARFGFTDIVCSPHEAKAIRQEARFDHLDLNTPSIRRTSDAPDDQARTATPAEAKQWRVKRVVVGRPISKSNDPQAVVEEIAADMLSAVVSEGAVDVT